MGAVVSTSSVDIPLPEWEDVAWRTKVVDLARLWIGTPYHHQASVRGVGTDCFGLIRGVWRELYGLDDDPEKMPPYSWDWAEAKNEETMLAAARRHMDEVLVAAAGAGDVLLFRYKAGYNAKHAGILTGGGRIIHATYGVKTCEVHLSDWWMRRAAGAFRFRREGSGM
jgi:NlpC/P60 family putative phage cell wall peptidase